MPSGPTLATIRRRSSCRRTEARGIQQAGLAVRKGKAYTGRVVLAGPAGTVVKVNLVWGKADGDKQTAVVTIAGTGYKKYPLRFVAQADTDDARIQIVATGAGRLHIGAASLMPADNIQGFRAEVIAALTNPCALVSCSDPSYLAYFRRFQRGIQLS